MAPFPVFDTSYVNDVELKLKDEDDQEVGELKNTYSDIVQLSKLIEMDSIENSVSQLVYVDDIGMFPNLSALLSKWDMT